MAESKVLERPRQVTMAAIVGLVSSVLLVLSLFDALGRIRSSEMRKAIDEFLATPPGNGLGVGYEDIASLLRVVVFVNGALAATAAVLSVYLLQRHQGARVVFSVAAALLLVSAPVTGGALAILVAFAATLLWGKPARDWFAGREPAPAADSARNGHPATPPRPSPEWPPPPGGGQQQSMPATPPGPGPSNGHEPAPAAYPFGERPAAAWAPPAYGQQPAPGPGRAPASRRPRTVLAAAVITWLASGVVLMGFFGIVVGLLVAQDVVLDALEGSPELAGTNLSTQDLLALLWVLSAVFLFWTLAAMTLAVLAFRRFNWARIALVVSAAFAGLLAATGGVPGLVFSAAALATIVLLFTGGANAWYAGDRRQPPDRPAPPAGPGAQYPGPPPGQPGAQPPPYPGPPPAQPTAQPPADQPRKKTKPPVW